MERDQNISVRRANRSGVGIGHVDAADRQADIVDDRTQRRGRDDRPDGRLDLIDLNAGFFNSRSSRRAHVQCDLGAFDRGEEVAAEVRREREREREARRKPAMKRTVRTER